MTPTRRKVHWLVVRDDSSRQRSNRQRSNRHTGCTALPPIRTRVFRESSMRTNVLLCIPVVLMLAAEASGQCRVEGVARSADGTPMGGATVRLEGSEYRRPPTTVTDADGRYAFADVKAGTRVRIVAVQAGRPVAQAVP